MKLIDISTHKHPNTFAMVDDADFDFLNQWKWGAHTGGCTIYAERTSRKNYKAISYSMHRVILGLCGMDIVDHKDGNGLNNQRENLRICTHNQNAMNRRKHKNGSSPYKGVYKVNSGYRAIICLDGRNKNLGRFKTSLEAAIAYNLAAEIYHGAFARLNTV